MFEISTKPNEKFDFLKSRRKIYKEGIYDFTFEDRFIVYHAPFINTNVFYAVDIKTGCGSEVIRLNDKEVENLDYKDLLNPILFSIKYTGDDRYINVFAYNTEELIESIFRNIFPKYGFAVREEQIKLCKNIYRGLTGKRVAICEAEVGTGKTMAYLVAGVCARRSCVGAYSYSEPVTISTSSIELQKSIIEKEIPILSKMLIEHHLLDKPLVAVLRKGKEHYFCPSRYNGFIKNISKTPGKYEKTIEFFEKTGFANHAFDLDKYKISNSLKNRVCVKGSCSKCKHKASCRYDEFISNVRSDRYFFDFQITNHNLYLMSNMEYSTLRDSSFVIIDEAHKLVEAARDTYGESINEHLVYKYLGMVKDECEKNIQKDVYHELLVKTNRYSKTLFGFLRKRILEGDEDLDFKSLISLTPKEKDCIARIIGNISTIETMRKPPHAKVELSGILIIKSLQRFLKSSEISVWLDEAEDDSIDLCCSENNIGLNLMTDVWSRNRGYVLLSGTMSDGNDFAYFKKENGINRIKKDMVFESSTPSPFNYEKHTRLYMPRDLPIPKDNDDEAYINAISKKIVELVKASHGHTAILFTSYKALTLCYEKTKEELNGYDVFCMSRADRNVITDFKKSKNGVLFASGSMWEGVDCRGDCLSSLIIVRLPFPIRSASLEVKKNEYEDVETFINECAVPSMLIKLRQGMGRLIRSEADTGLITILDTRASNKRYKPYIDGVTNRYPKVKNIDEIAEFFASVKDKEYFN